MKLPVIHELKGNLSWLCIVKHAHTTLILLLENVLTRFIRELLTAKALTGAK